MKSCSNDCLGRHDNVWPEKLPILRYPAKLAGILSLMHLPTQQHPSRSQCNNARARRRRPIKDSEGNVQRLLQNKCVPRPQAVVNGIQWVQMIIISGTNQQHLILNLRSCPHALCAQCCFNITGPFRSHVCLIKEFHCLTNTSLCVHISLVSGSM